MRIFSAFVLLLAGASAAHAADVTDVVPGHPGVTFEMLLKQVMPDLAKGTDGHWSSTHLPHLRGYDGKVEEGAELSFDDVQALTLREAGHTRLALVTGDSQTDSGFSAILAVYDTATPVPKLMDYMDVGGDRFVALGDPRTLAIAPDTDALMINNNHFNSNENYSQDTAYFLNHGRIDSAFSQFTLNEGFCGYEERQVPTYTVHDDKGARFRAITISVLQTIKHTDETCDDGSKILPAGSHTYADTLYWDAHRNAYVSRSNNLSHLIQQPPDQ
jgi:hypothetical protein